MLNDIKKWQKITEIKLKIENTQIKATFIDKFKQHVKYYCACVYVFNDLLCFGVLR